MASHYVDNKEFLVAMKEYRDKVLAAKEGGTPMPPIPNYVGECILKIANHLSYKPCFINYSYRDDMISDGIENCIQYINNFDPNKSSNPFSYFTQIIYYAFLRRIAKEKKQSYIKHKIIQDMPYEIFEIQAHDEDGQFTSHFLDFIQTAQSQKDFTSFEKKLERIPKKKDNINLENFIGEEDESGDNIGERT
jgi:DNA-directed RNA polymerase specialized sigma subunit